MKKWLIFFACLQLIALASAQISGNFVLIEVEAPETVSIIEGEREVVEVTVSNTGQEALRDVTLEVRGLPESVYLVTPRIIEIIESGESEKFSVEITSEYSSEEGSVVYVVTSGELTKTASSRLILVSSENLEDEDSSEDLLEVSFSNYFFVAIFFLVLVVLYLTTGFRFMFSRKKPLVEKTIKENYFDRKIAGIRKKLNS